MISRILESLRRRSRSSMHGRYTRDYRALVKYLMRTQPRDKAMEIAIGHNDSIGDVEFAILDQYGLRAENYLIDVGCGSGRLARRAALSPRLGYLGTDVSQDLLDYARESCGRTDFRFVCVDSVTIPERDGVADFVAFFSVGTHMLHEEFFVYLEDARRVLRPGGRIVFSFLDFQSPPCHGVFTELVRKVRAGEMPPHLDVFIGRDDLKVWAELLDMTVIEISPGDVARPASESVRATLGRDPPNVAFGQSVAVFQKR
jgi:ubiquinone/menaquinone biosynthesis C-methylase UbiE